MPNLSARSRNRIFIFTLIATLTMAVVLWLLGRRIWCKCGQWWPWSWDIYSLHNSQHLIDPYTFTHVLHGFVFFGGLWMLRHRLTAETRWTLCVIIEAVWEVLENTPLIIDRYRETTISLDYYGDSIANSVFDLAACLVGYLIAMRLRWYYTAILFFAVELALLLTIRDSLLLNVIMLLFPSESILEWQSAIA